MIVGLTGGIGSGKSTVAAMFADRGAVVIDTDAIAREVVEPPSPVLDAINYEFGTGVITPDGHLDREKMARIVFADPRQRELLNRLTHPAIRERTVELMRAQPPDAMVVVVVPLLFETEFDALCDAVVAVVADPDMRRSRAAQRDKMNEESVAARMSAQLADEEYARRATYVVHNDGDLTNLESQVGAVLSKIRAGG